jgi:hypothetical protein
MYSAPSRPYRRDMLLPLILFAAVNLIVPALCLR